MGSRASIDVGYVGPNQTSKVQVAAGLYSLSSRSNVPYVSLIGASGFYKIFSWGEIVEVPCGQTCTVKNESFHGGDVFINAGEDFDNCPARVTVPVFYDLTPGKDVNGFVLPEFPADVRRARKAFLTCQIYAEDPITIIQIGQRVDGSHRTGDFIAPVSNALLGGAIKGVGYALPVSWPAQTYLKIPLGHLTVPGEMDAHTLLTTGWILLPNTLPTITLDLNSYYTLEY